MHVSLIIKYSSFNSYWCINCIVLIEHNIIYYLFPQNRALFIFCYLEKKRTKETWVSLLSKIIFCNAYENSIHLVFNSILLYII